MEKQKANVELEVELEVRDKNGKLISVHRQQSKSLLKNFARILRTMFLAVGGQSTYAVSTTLTDTSGASKTFYGAYTYGSGNSGLAPMCANAPSGNDAHGIQVGSSSTAVTRDDFQLGGKIANGTSAGQLSYGSMTVEDTDGTAPDTIFRLIRTFTNNTSSAITVYEIGLVIANTYISAGSGTTNYFLIARDVLSAPQSIPAGATLTVRYIFKVTA